MFARHARVRSAKSKKCCCESVFVTNGIPNHFREHQTSSLKIRTLQYSSMDAFGMAVHVVSLAPGEIESGGTKKLRQIGVEIDVRMHDSENLATESSTSGSTIHR